MCRNTDHLDTREINDLECRALAMLRNQSLLNPARNRRKSNMSKPCRRDGHDTKTGKSPKRSTHVTGDRISCDDGPDSPDPNTLIIDMDAEQTVSPGRCITFNRRSTRLSAQPCQEKKRKHETQKQVKRKSRTNKAGSTDYKARQDLDEGDADGTKLYNTYKRGEQRCFGQTQQRRPQPLAEPKARVRCFVVATSGV